MRCHSYGHNSRKCNLPPPVVEESQVENEQNANIGESQVQNGANVGQSQVTNTDMHTDASQPQEGNSENQPRQTQRGRPRTRGSNPAATPATGGNLSQPVSTNSQNQSQPKQREGQKEKIQL